MTQSSPEIHICSLEEAIAYDPVQPTYAIRIFSPSADDSLYPLEDSPLFTTIQEHFFDDTFPDMPFDVSTDPQDIYVPFVPDMAYRIISEFEQQYRNETLLVHCKYGMNRSPAIAIALNDIFSLGHDSEYLQHEFPEYREYIYEVMIDIAISHFPYLLEGEYVKNE